MAGPSETASGGGVVWNGRKVASLAHHSRPFFAVLVPSCGQSGFPSGPARMAVCPPVGFNEQPQERRLLLAYFV